MLSDTLALILASVVAGYVRYEDLTLPKTYPGYWEQAGLVALYAGLFWLLGWHGGIYDPENLLGGQTEYQLVFRTAVYACVALMIVGYLFQLPALPRAWWVTTLVASIFLACMARFGVRRIAYRLRQRGLFITRLLIAGANDQGVEIARQLLWSADTGFQVIGFVDDYLPAGTRVALGDPRGTGGDFNTPARDGVLEVLGGTGQLGEVASEHGVHEAIVIPEAVSWEGLQTVVAFHSAVASSLKIHLSASLYDMVASSMNPTQRALVPLLTFGSKRLVGLDALLKSSFDWVVGGLLLLLLSPVALTVAIAGWLRGARPVLERRTVVGVGGWPVRMPLLSKRITTRMPLRGAPALLCVLAGRMSLVGPRPIAQDEAAKYARWEPLLVAMRPGLTGYWRLLPEDATLEKAAAWDLWYLRNYSIWTDLFLLFKTGWAAFNKQGRLGPASVRRWEVEVPSEKPMSWSA